MSAAANWEQWCTVNQSSGVWQAAGFAAIPCYGTMYSHFVRLEGHVDAAAEARTAAAAAGTGRPSGRPSGPVSLRLSHF